MFMARIASLRRQIPYKSNIELPDAILGQWHNDITISNRIK